MERFWGTLRLHLVHDIRLQVVRLRLDGLLDFDDDRDYVSAQRVVVAYANEQLSELVPEWNIRYHSRGQQQGRPDATFGDRTGSKSYYRRLARMGDTLPLFPRDPLPPAGQPAVRAVFDALRLTDPPDFCCLGSCVHRGAGRTECYRD